MNTTSLSPSQILAENTFTQFLGDPTEKELVIGGFAGSGKTFLVKRLIELTKQYKKLQQSLAPIDNPFDVISDVGFKICVTATTNKAAKVLSNAVNMQATTIHSFLGLTPKNDYKTGKVVLKTSPNTYTQYDKIVFIDEASMINKQLLQFIRDYIDDSCKIVFIGDPYQLAPVGENNSIVFARPKNFVELKEIQRQLVGSPIIELSKQFRDILDTGKPSAWPEILQDSTEIQSLSGEDFKDVVTQKFSQPHAVDDLKIIAWSNERVLSYNNFIRQLNTANPDFEVGEKVITNKPILNMGGGIEIPTDSIVTITEIVPWSQDGFEGFMVNVNHQHKKYFFPRDWKEVNKVMRQLAKIKNWAEYFRVKEDYLDLRSLHAITCHKSQGSTYREVFVDLSDIGRNNKWHEVARLVYVAISRASKRVYLYGELPIKNWK